MSAFQKLTAKKVGLPADPAVRCNVDECCARPPYVVHNEHGRFFRACQHHAEEATGKISTRRTEGEAE